MPIAEQRPGRPLGPTRCSQRLRKKRKLEDGDDCLAQKCEEIELLQKSSRIVQEAQRVHRVVVELTSKLSAARKRIDEMVKDRENLEIDIKHLRAEKEFLKSRENLRENECHTESLDAMTLMRVRDQMVRDMQKYQDILVAYDSKTAACLSRNLLKSPMQPKGTQPKGPKQVKKKEDKAVSKYQDKDEPKCVHCGGTRHVFAKC